MRRTSLANSLAALLALCVTTASSCQATSGYRNTDGKQTNTIDVTALRVVDPAGRVRAFLGLDRLDQSVLELYGTEGRPALSIIASPNGSSQLAAFDNAGEARLVLLCSNRPQGGILSGIKLIDGLGDELVLGSGDDSVGNVLAIGTRTPGASAFLSRYGIVLGHIDPSEPFDWSRLEPRLVLQVDPMGAGKLEIADSDGNLSFVAPPE